MGIQVGVSLFFYITIAILMCAFILVTEDSESLGNPSPIREVRSSQKTSVLEYIVGVLAGLFLISYLALNHFTRRQGDIIGNLKATATQQAQAVDKEKSTAQIEVQQVMTEDQVQKIQTTQDPKTELAKSTESKIVTEKQNNAEKVPSSNEVNTANLQNEIGNLLEGI